MQSRARLHTHVVALGVEIVVGHEAEVESQLGDSSRTQQGFQPSLLANVREHLQRTLHGTLHKLVAFAVNRGQGEGVAALQPVRPFRPHLRALHHNCHTLVGGGGVAARKLPKQCCQPFLRIAMSTSPRRRRVESSRGG